MMSFRNERLHIDRREMMLGAAACSALSLTMASGARAAGVPSPALRSGVATVAGVRVPYRTEAGETVLRNDRGVARATIFAASYIAAGRSAGRPVSFVFNGGPGGATWPLHSTVSPRQFSRAANARGFVIADNPDSPIDASDLVFIDAPGTGFSRILSDDAIPEYWGIEQDAAAVALFIEDWLRRHGRSRSPVYLFGESYGGTRIAQILRILALRDRSPLRPAGVVLVSPTMGGMTPFDFMDEDRSYILSFPTMATTARWHGRGAYTSVGMAEVAGKATAFAKGGYQDALRRYDALRPPEREAIAQQAATYVGLSPDLLLRERLRVPMDRFGMLTMAGEGKRLYRADGRASVVLPPPGGTESVLQTGDGYDLGAAIDALLREDLGYATGSPYVRDPTEAGRRWNRGTGAAPNRLTDVLNATVARHPEFRVLLFTGYFDLLVPYQVPDTMIADSGFPAASYRHVVYEAGHATFSDPVSRPAAADCLRSFYREGGAR